MPTAALDCMKSSSFSSLTTYSHPKAKGQIRLHICSLCRWPFTVFTSLKSHADGIWLIQSDCNINLDSKFVNPMCCSLLYNYSFSKCHFFTLNCITAKGLSVCELLNSFNSLYYMFLSFQVLNLWTSGLVSVSWDYRYCLDHGAGNMDENVIVVNVPVDTDNYHEKVSCSKTTLNYASNPAQVTGSICTLQDIQHQQINWNTLCYSFYADWFKRKTNVYYLLWFNSFWIEFGASEWQAVSVNTAAVPQWASFCFTLASLW